MSALRVRLCPRAFSRIVQHADPSHGSGAPLIVGEDHLIESALRMCTSDSTVCCLLPPKMTILYLPTAAATCRVRPGPCFPALLVRSHVFVSRLNQ